MSSIRTQLHGMTRGQRAGECYPKTTTTNLSMADNTLISKNYPRIFGGTLQPKSKNISADKWPIILWVGCPAYWSTYLTRFRGYVTALTGRALDWQSRGQRFDPAILHQEKPWNHKWFRGFFLYMANCTKSLLCWIYVERAGKFLRQKTLKPQRFMFIGTQCNLWGKPDGTGHGK